MQKLCNITFIFNMIEILRREYTTFNTSKKLLNVLHTDMGGGESEPNVSDKKQELHSHDTTLLAIHYHHL